MKAINVECLGVCFDARNVVTKSKELFISSYGGSKFAALSDEERQSELSNVYDKCQMEVAKDIAASNKTESAEDEQMPEQPQVNKNTDRKVAKPRKGGGVTDEDAAGGKE